MEMPMLQTHEQEVSVKHPPYEIKKNGEPDAPYCVFNSLTGVKVGCTTEDKLDAYLAALYVNMSEEEKEALAKVGRRVRGSRVEQLQEAIDFVQAEIDDLQGALLKLEEFIAWARYADMEESETPFTSDFIQKPLTELGKGGPGSGHHGHAGIPGQRGGSAPGGAYLGLPMGARRPSRRAAEEIVKFGIKTGREAAIALDAEGNQINGMVKGGTWVANITPLVEGGQAKVLIHNHPDDATFSQGDVIAMFQAELDYSVVIGHGGSVYSLSRTNRTPTQMSMEDISKIYHKYDKPMMKQWEIRVEERWSTGEDLGQEAWNLEGHKVMELMAEDLGLRYIKWPVS